MQILKEISLFQMRLQYLLDEDTRQVGLQMVPAGCEAVALDKSGSRWYLWFRPTSPGTSIPPPTPEAGAWD